MDYSMFSRPKLHDSEGIRYYPEYEYPVDQSYHYPHPQSHSVLPSEDEYQASVVHRKQRTPRSTSMRPRCNSERRCPIYVHPIPPPPESFDQNRNLSQNTYRKVTNYLNDLQHIEQEPNISARSQKISTAGRKSTEKSKKAVLTKLEESYWANWKPPKEPAQDSYFDRCSLSKGTRNKTQPKKHKCKAKKQGYDNELLTMVGHYAHQDCDKVQGKPSAKDAATLPVIDEERSRGISNDCGDDSHMQVDSPCDLSGDLKQSFNEEDDDKKTEVLYAGPGHRDALSDENTTDNNGEMPLRQLTSSELLEQSSQEDANRLKHTDSLILTKNKKQSEEKRSYQQPKCIRLYKKPGPSTTAGLVRGGTYPLKSCLKKESSFGGKRNIRLGRPGSPLIVTSNYYNNFPRSFRK